MPSFSSDPAGAAWSRRHFLKTAPLLAGLSLAGRAQAADPAPTRPIRLAIVGFRHGHINSVISQARRRKDVVLTGVCEEDAATRAQIAAQSWECPVFDSYTRMLDTVECDVIGIGDYYARRGALCIEALTRGKHVISDKPVCTRREELARIEALVAQRGLVLGCQFSLRSNRSYRRLRRLVRAGGIGEVHAISTTGQHPLNYGRRPAWFFEEGKHGGTINDIGVHATDLIPWITGLRFAQVTAARNWNARLKEKPFFLDAAQAMLTLENRAGVLGDFSYLAPDEYGGRLPYYWQTVLWGTEGVAEVGPAKEGVTVHRARTKQPEVLEPEPADPQGGYFADFLAQVQRQPLAEGALTTADVLQATRAALLAQHAAETGATQVSLLG